MKAFWNERYGQKEFVYGKNPNDFFREQLIKLNPGKILLPAEGEGRNAVFAARRGWDVTAFDHSEAGKVKAMQLAEDHGVSIDYQVAGASEFKLDQESLDAVALIYAHLPEDIWISFHQKLILWLKPGGKVILEAFHPKQFQYKSGGPKDERMMYTADMLEAEFKSFNISYLEELEITLNEGRFHQGKGYVVRMLAEKPKSTFNEIHVAE